MASTAKPSASGAKPARAVASKGRRARVDADQLAPLFSATLGPWHRATLEKPLPDPLPGPHAGMRAKYTQGALSAVLSISTDLPRNGSDTTRTTHENFRADRKESSVSMALGNGLLIVAISQGADATALRALIESMDLAQAESLRPAKP